MRRGVKLNKPKLQYLKAAKERYLEIDKKVKNYRNQFLESYWGEKPVKKELKVLTKKAHQELVKLENELEKAHNEFIQALRDLHV